MKSGVSAWLMLIVLSYINIILISVFGHEFLPAKYFYDSGMILNNIFDISIYPQEIRFFDAYYNTAVLYNTISSDMINPPGVYLRILSSIIAWFPISILMVMCKKHGCKVRMVTAFIIFSTSIFVGIYCGQRSKEVIAIWFSFIVFYFILTGRIKLSYIMILIYALFFRSYWVLVLGLLIALKLSNYFRFVLRYYWLQVLITVSSFFLLISMVYFQMEGIYLTDVRLMVNKNRVPADSVTLINNLLVNSNSMTDLFNFYMSFIRIIFPFELFRFFELKYFLYLSYWFTFLIVIMVEIGSKKLYFKDEVNFLFSLFIVFTMFEPDFGSFLKHSLILVPGYFVILIMGSEYKNKTNAY